MPHLAANKQLKSKVSKQAGFTLIEIISAIVLIGVLSVITAPGMIGFLARSKVISATSDLQGLFQEAQKSAIRDSETCTLSLPEDGASSLDTTTGALSFSMSCIDTGSRDLESIQVRHNFDAVHLTYNSANPTAPVNLFDFKGSTEDFLSNNLVLVISHENDEIFQKCIVISDGLGLIRVGNYPSNVTDVDITRCSPSS